MDFTNLIGKHFDHLNLDAKDYSMEFEDWMIEEGLEPTWTVKSRDGSYEMSLNEDKIIETIWLYPLEGVFRFMDYTEATTKDQIQEKLGPPTSHDEFIQSFVDYSFVDWIRYDDDKTSIHYEFSSADSNLLKITIMDINVAP